MHTFVIRGNRQDGYSWCLFAPNGETVCHGDTYRDMSSCRFSIDYLKREIGNATIRDESGEEL